MAEGGAVPRGARARDFGANSTVSISEALGIPIKMTCMSGDTFDINEPSAYRIGTRTV
jgi:hypothetical protein